MNLRRKTAASTAKEKASSGPSSAASVVETATSVAAAPTSSASIAIQEPLPGVSSSSSSTSAAAGVVAKDKENVGGARASTRRSAEKVAASGDKKASTSKEDAEPKDKSAAPTTTDAAAAAAVTKESNPSASKPADYMKVRSSDHSRIMQWPLFMIRQTKCEPPLVYAVNPLHFTMDAAQRSMIDPAVIAAAEPSEDSCVSPASVGAGSAASASGSNLHFVPRSVNMRHSSSGGNSCSPEKEHPSEIPLPPGDAPESSKKKRSKHKKRKKKRALPAAYESAEDAEKREKKKKRKAEKKLAEEEKGGAVDEEKDGPPPAKKKKKSKKSKKEKKSKSAKKEKKVKVESVSGGSPVQDPASIPLPEVPLQSIQLPPEPEEAVMRDTVPLPPGFQSGKSVLAADLVKTIKKEDIPLPEKINLSTVPLPSDPPPPLPVKLVAPPAVEPVLKKEEHPFVGKPISSGPIGAWHVVEIGNAVDGEEGKKEEVAAAAAAESSAAVSIAMTGSTTPVAAAVAGANTPTPTPSAAPAPAAGLPIMAGHPMAATAGLPPGLQLLQGGVPGAGGPPQGSSPHPAALQLFLHQQQQHQQQQAAAQQQLQLQHAALAQHAAMQQQAALMAGMGGGVLGAAGAGAGAAQQPQHTVVVGPNGHLYIQQRAPGPAVMMPR